MKRYDEKVLNSLLDKYENSLLYTGQNQRKQSIEFPVKKSTLPEYFDETSMQFELAIFWKSVCCRQNVRKKFMHGCSAEPENKRKRM